MTQRLALVTGGTRGIGRGIAAALAREGLDLFLAGRRPAIEVTAVLDELRALGAAVHYHAVDLEHEHAPIELIDAVRRVAGRLHVLVNNAGVGPAQRLDLLDATPQSFDRVLAVNLRAPYFLAQAAARWMIEQRGSDPQHQGCIVQISSISAVVASPDRGEYCVAKAGLSMATQLFAARLGEHGIPVYELQPGIVATDMTARVKEKYDQKIAQGLLVEPRWGTPEDIGRAVAALVRGDLPYATGQVIRQDGGLTLRRL